VNITGLFSEEESLLNETLNKRVSSLELDISQRDSGIRDGVKAIKKCENILRSLKNISSKNSIPRPQYKFDIDFGGENVVCSLDMWSFKEKVEGNVRLDINSIGTYVCFGVIADTYANLPDSKSWEVDSKIMLHDITVIKSDSEKEILRKKFEKCRLEISKKVAGLFSLSEQMWADVLYKSLDFLRTQSDKQKIENCQRQMKLNQYIEAANNIKKA